MYEFVRCFIDDDGTTHHVFYSEFGKRYQASEEQLMPRLEKVEWVPPSFFISDSNGRKRK